ncbi:MAG: serine/threonine-protein phosphatase [Anaerolineales bacterium]|nr:serine/threonine-protein phosphatase [Anaerolineales bacterium]
MSSILNVTSAVLTHPGRKRPHNEDFVAYYEPETYSEWAEKGCLYIVADGVGGAAKGEKASQFAAQDVLFRYDNDADPDPGARLRRALRAAGNAIYDHAERSGSFTRMATTMVAAVVRGDRLTVANVGDSRAYLIRSGNVHQITTDHTIAGEMLHHGEITEAEAQHLKGKNRITRSIGGERDVRVDIFADIQLLPGDKLLLCSDGLARYTLTEDILHLTAEGSPADIVQRCITFANQRGGADNISTALVEIGHPAQPGSVPSRSGSIPAAVDWEEMVTQPSVEVSPLAAAHPGKKKWVLLIGGFLIAAVAIAFSLSRLLQPADPGAAGTETAAPLQPGASPARIDDMPVGSGEGETQATAITPAETTDADLPLVSDTPPLQPPTRCIYTVDENDIGLLSILSDFGIQDPERQARLGEVLDLTTGETLAEPDDIKVGQELILPFITDGQTCTDGGGEWKQLPPRGSDTNE